MYRVRDFAEERARTLYVRLPHRIRDPRQVQEILDGDAIVKLPRQASRACHVIFPNLEEKTKGLEKLKNTTVNGKQVIALHPRTEPQKNRTRPKKLVVPKPKPEKKSKITQSLFVSNIKNKTSIADLKKALPGSTSVTMLNVNPMGLRSAFVKMESVLIAGQYIRKEREIPIVNGNQLVVNVDTRIREKRRGSHDKKLKMYSEQRKATQNTFKDLKNKKVGKKTIYVPEGHVSEYTSNSESE